MISRRPCPFGNDTEANDWNGIMSSNKSADSTASDGGKWNDAWETVSRLAAAQKVALRELTGPPTVPSVVSEHRDLTIGDSGARAPVATIDQGHLASALAEIETASAALKSMEPSLVPWFPQTEQAQTQTQAAG